VILLTGATGFVGMEVLVRLLEQTDRDILCLVRAHDHAAAERRLNGVLETLYRDPSRHAGRVQALAGDLTGDIAAPPRELDLVCHCAASISFDLPLEEARAINVEGTRAMLGLARAAGARRFVHVSTAYVAGTRPGDFGEDMLDDSTFSAGIAVLDVDGADFESLVRVADARMYAAKAAGRARICAGEPRRDDLFGA